MFWPPLALVSIEYVEPVALVPLIGSPEMPTSPKPSSPSIDLLANSTEQYARDDTPTPVVTPLKVFPIVFPKH